jgi:hypothetical protein
MIDIGPRFQIINASAEILDDFDKELGVLMRVLVKHIAKDFIKGVIPALESPLVDGEEEGLSYSYFSESTGLARAALSD